MFPVMSLIVILIPFLVGNVAFMQFDAILATTPGQASADQQQEREQKKVIAQLFVSPDKLRYVLLDEDTGSELSSFELANNSVGQKELKSRILGIRGVYRKLDTVLISVAKGMKYQTIMEVLDNCRAATVSGVKDLNLVILPGGMAS